jgi:hypothetical protein
MIRLIRVDLIKRKKKKRGGGRFPEGDAEKTINTLAVNFFRKAVEGEMATRKLAWQGWRHLFFS